MARRTLSHIAPLALLILLAAIALFGVIAQRVALASLTGEGDFFPQVKALSDLAGDQLRPRVETADDVLVPYAGVNPFGVNVFLEQEVEPAKREQAVRMAAAAGFHWLRQEFPWEDIEIHGKGDFEDRRHQPYRSAWEKYDDIVALAERYGLELIVRLSNPPEWTRAHGAAAGTFAPPDNYDDFGDFVAAVVSRYRGRVRYYQIWNEPNIYPEWGERPVNPEEYVELLKIAYTRAKAADPNVVILCGALASTIELGPRDLNDFVFLQRMYDAGAAPYFDVLATQGYGLWSGPDDHRMHPRVINFSRPLFLRDLMVKNGDAHKAIWISEMNWNAIPPHHPAPPIYGRYSEEEQARFLVQAYERIQREWPWLGVANVWFLKRATDEWERADNHPEAFFRLLRADFTPLPAYLTIQNYTKTLRPTLYTGAHASNHWALTYEGPWEEIGIARRTSAPSARLRFRAEGDEVALLIPLDEPFNGVRVQVAAVVGAVVGDVGGDVVGDAEILAVEQDARNDYRLVWLARGLGSGTHEFAVGPLHGALTLVGVRVGGARTPLSLGDAFHVR